MGLVAVISLNPQDLLKKYVKKNAFPLPCSYDTPLWRAFMLY